MKKHQISLRKLRLTKERIAELGQAEQNRIKGGLTEIAGSGCSLADCTVNPQCMSSTCPPLTQAGTQCGSGPTTPCVCEI